MFKKALIAGAVLASLIGNNAFAQSTLSIEGSITPNACSINMGGIANGVVNYGQMSVAEVQGFDNTIATVYKADPKTIDLTIKCDAGMKVSLNLNDEHAPSKFAVDANDAYGYGLGIASGDGSKIGQYRVDFSGMVANTLKGDPQVALPGFFVRPKGSPAATVWGVAAAMDATNFNSASDLSFKAVALDTQPSKVAELATTLTVTSYFNKAMVDAATEEIKIDGLSTFTVNYL